MQHLDPSDASGVESQRQAHRFGPDGGMQIAEGNGHPGDAIALGGDVDHPTQTAGNQLREPESAISATQSDLEGATFSLDLQLQGGER